MRLGRQAATFSILIMLTGGCVLWILAARGSSALTIDGMGAKASLICFDSVDAYLGKVAHLTGTASHTFQFRNGTSHNVTIRSVITSCGCTVSAYSQDPVRPGGSGWVKITMDSTAMNKIGRVTQKATVFFNELPSEKFTLSLGVDVARAVSVDPWPVDFGGVDAAIGNAIHISIRNELEQTIAVKKIDTANGSVDVEMVDRELMPGKPVDAILRLSRTHGAGPVSDTVSMATDSTFGGVVRIPVTGVVYAGGVKTSPASISLGVIQKATRPTRLIRLESVSKAPLKVLRVSSTTIPCDAEFGSGDAIDHEIRVSWDVASAHNDGKVDGKVEVVYLSGTRQASAAIPLSAYIVPSLSPQQTR